MISRNFIFTLNNPVTVQLPAQWFADGNVTYVEWQLEEGANGTRHLQGYFQTKKNPKNKNGFSLKWCKDNINPMMHIEKRMGTHEEAVEYVTKTDTRKDGPWKLGEYEGQTAAANKKNKDNLNDVKKLIDEGKTDDELWQSHFSIMTRYHKTFNAYRLSLRNKERAWHTRCLVLYGPPKTGKSRLAQQIGDAQGGAFWLRKPKQGGTDWWDGYNGQKVVVIDEFYGWLPFDMLCRMLDRYPYQVETKGSMLPFLAELVIFTSNVSPRSWYSDEAVPNDRWQAFVRRMSGVEGTVRLMDVPYAGENDDDGTKFEDLVDNIAAGECDIFGRAADVLTNDGVDVEGSEEIDNDGRIKRKLIDLTQDEDDLGNTSGGEYEETSQPYEEDFSCCDTVGHKQTCINYVSPREYEEERGLSAIGRQYELGIEKQYDKRWGNQPNQSKLKLIKRSKQNDDLDEDFDDK